MTVPRNLDQLTDRASDRARHRRQRACREAPPSSQISDTVVVTLRVHDTLKGHAAGTYTFRQYIWDLRDRYDAAGYRKGQDLLLLMIAPSEYGLSSPAGMNQGRFRIERDRAGREVAVNGADNLRLFDGLAAADKTVGAPQAGEPGAKHRKGPVELAGSRR